MSERRTVLCCKLTSPYWTTFYIKVNLIASVDFCFIECWHRWICGRGRWEFNRYHLLTYVGCSKQKFRHTTNNFFLAFMPACFWHFQVAMFWYLVTADTCISWHILVNFNADIWNIINTNFLNVFSSYLVMVINGLNAQKAQKRPQNNVSGGQQVLQWRRNTASKLLCGLSSRLPLIFHLWSSVEILSSLVWYNTVLLLCSALQGNYG